MVVLQSDQLPLVSNPTTGVVVGALHLDVSSCSHFCGFSRKTEKKMSAKLHSISLISR